MRTTARAILCLTALVAPSLAAAAPDPRNTCIIDTNIDNTDRPNDTTILFTMRDHSVWKNTLPVRCFGLHNEPDGFTYQPTDPGTQELCSNQVTIRLNFNQTVCQLGDFTRVK